MVKKKRTGDTAHRFVESTVKLIAEREGSHDVNLRNIAREVGCAHTNVYNYFNGVDELMWKAMESVLFKLGEYLQQDLSDSLPPKDYLEQLMTNYVEFAEEQPGFFRFISTDPLVSSEIPENIQEIIQSLVDFFNRVFQQLSEDKLDHPKAAEVGSIILAYLEGDLLDMINGRYFPGDDIRGRVVRNSLHLYELLTSNTNNGVKLDGMTHPRSEPYPRLSLGKAQGMNEDGGGFDHEFM